MRLHPTLAAVLDGVPDPILIASAVLVALGLLLVALALLEQDAADAEPTLLPVDAPLDAPAPKRRRRWRRSVVRCLELVGVALVVAAVVLAGLLVASGL